MHSANELVASLEKLSSLPAVYHRIREQLESPDGSWPIAIAAMAASLITNLAALPTRITIPTLFISVLIDVAIVVTAIISVL
jgi:hypothetical protein